jgi:hypothetical protein
LLDRAQDTAVYLLSTVPGLPPIALLLLGWSALRYSVTAVTSEIVPWTGLHSRPRPSPASSLLVWAGVVLAGRWVGHLS